MQESVGEEKYASYRQNMNRLQGRITGAKRTGQAVRSMRLPLMILASRLEVILMDIWRKRTAQPFHKPVDSREYPEYRQKVVNPISLTDIRTNTGASLL